MVQVLKEELRLAILKAALEEFKEQGYILSSMKKIAVKAGISVGNVYRYFKGKEALFDAIVTPVYDELERVIGVNGNGIQPLRDGSIVDRIADSLTAVITELREPLLILIDGSQGTRHEDAIQKLHKIMVDNVTEHLIAYNRKQTQEVYTEHVTWPISVAFVQGYFEIIRRYPEPEECGNVIRQYISFWYQGLKVFIEGE